MTGRLPRCSGHESPGQPGELLPPRRRRGVPIASEERLVLVVGHVLDGQDHVAPQKPADVGRVAALEEPARRPDPQRPQPDLDEAAHVGLELGPVADGVDDVERGPLQLGQGGDGRFGRAPGRPGPVTTSQPASSYTRCSACDMICGNGSSAPKAAWNRARTMSMCACTG